MLHACALLKVTDPSSEDLAMSTLFYLIPNHMPLSTLIEGDSSSARDGMRYLLLSGYGLHGTVGALVLLNHRGNGVGNRGFVGFGRLLRGQMKSRFVGPSILRTFQLPSEAWSIQYNRSFPCHPGNINRISSGLLDFLQ